MISDKWRGASRTAQRWSSIGQNIPLAYWHPNTCGELATETELTPAIQTMHHNETYPSHVTLPLILCS